MNMEIINNGQLYDPSKRLSIGEFKAIIYVRTSTEDQADKGKISIPDQINWAKQMCSERGWEFAGSYVDKLPGDVEFDSRPEGARLLEDAKFNLFNLVLFYHSSRLAREPWVGLKTIANLGKLKIQVYIRNAPNEPIIPDSFMYGGNGNVASEYLNALSLVGDKQENIARSERVTSGFKNLAQKGILVFAPYGLKKIPEIISSSSGKQSYSWHFEENPSEIAIVKRIYNDFLGGKSLRKLTKDLIKDKISSPTGKTGEGSWTAATVRNILYNPAYNGNVRWGRKLGSKYRQGRAESGRQKRVITKPDKWILTKSKNSPKVINDDKWNKVQDRLKRRGKISGRQLATDSLFPGLVYCGDCNRRAICKTRKYKKNGKEYIRTNFIDQSYYRGLNCRRHLIAAKKLEELVLAKLQSRLEELQESDIEQILKNREQNTKASMLDSLKRIERQLGSYETKKSKLMELYLDEAIDRKDFDKQKEKIETDETVLIEEKSKIQSFINDQKKQVEGLKSLRELLEMFEEAKEQKVRKEMIHRIIDKIYVSENQIEILYHYGKAGTEWLNVKPHPCGFFGDPKRACRCLPGQIQRYQKRVSGPILDRIDIHVEVPSVETQKLIGKVSSKGRSAYGRKSTSSKEIQMKVQAARNIQTKRFKGIKLKSNSEMNTKEVKKYCELNEECRTILRSAVGSMNLTARSYFKVIKVARTIADLDGASQISTNHLAEALQYRPKDSDL
jgi:hypothetical protein